MMVTVVLVNNIINKPHYRHDWVKSEWGFTPAKNSVAKKTSMYAHW
jgi:hypothetical protein